MLNLKGTDTLDHPEAVVVPSRVCRDVAAQLREQDIAFETFVPEAEAALLQAGHTLPTGLAPCPVSPEDARAALGAWEERYDVCDPVVFLTAIPAQRLLDECLRAFSSSATAPDIQRARIRCMIRDNIMNPDSPRTLPLIGASELRFGDKPQRATEQTYDLDALDTVNSNLPEGIDLNALSELFGATSMDALDRWTHDPNASYAVRLRLPYDPDTLTRLKRIAGLPDVLGTMVLRGDDGVIRAFDCTDVEAIVANPSSYRIDTLYPVRDPERDLSHVAFPFEQVAQAENLRAMPERARIMYEQQYREAYAHDDEWNELALMDDLNLWVQGEQP